MDNIQEIKSRLNILEVVSGYIRVEKSGSQYKGRCPFHNERTPSFYVSPARGSYHCFGCSESGDIFKFVEKMENLEFKEALKILADRAGVTLSKIKKEDDSRMLSLMQHAKQFFEVGLAQSIEAKKYLHNRGMTDGTIKEFEIGFAKKDWRLLFVHLMTLGYTDIECAESGLVIKTEDNKYCDRFRGRIMFPIRNISGYTVGFTGRIMPEYDDGQSGKYVNTPETKLYHKSKILFNYDKAKKYIAENREVILVEGQMDAVMSYQAGIKNVVAVSGTAFTEDQVKMISRLADDVVLAFDNDDAGKKASVRASIMCAYGGLKIYTVDIKEKDIADMVLANPENLFVIYKNKISLIDDMSKNLNTKKDEREKIDYTKSVVIPYLKAIASPLERDFIINSFSRATNISTEAIKNEVDKHIQLDSYSSIEKSNEVIHNTPLAKISKKDDMLLTLNAIKIDLKIQDDFVLDAEIPEDIIHKKIIELESKMAMNIDYYNDIKKNYQKEILEEEKKIIEEKLKTGEITDEQAFILLNKLKVI